MKDKLLTSFLFAAVFLALASTAMASTTWYVNGVSGSDSNNCMSAQTACKTIGHAISLASSGDSVMIAAATYTENLVIRVNLKLIGSGATKTIIDGGGIYRVITIVDTAANVTLSKVTIRNGVEAFGGGIISSSSGTLTVTNSTISGNSAANSYSNAFGGAIYNSGTLTINNSTLNGNSASGFSGSLGGAIYNDGTLSINHSTLNGNGAGGRGGGGGGGIFINSGGTAKISNSTLSGNAAIGGGGGIANEGGTVTINNSTLSGNVTRNSGGGGGIANVGGTATLQNTIVANSPRGGNCYGAMTSDGYNLSSDSTCKFGKTGDLNSTDPMLGPLQNNGGQTQTMALLTGSPAIDAGNPAGCTDSQGHLLKTDQRGKPRPDTEDTGGCDMGAYERQSD
jgi:hypothetical protein